jgi:acetyl-CoA/propionyl-CoA carboxylase biotin carboxyl carrier protein
MLSKIIAWGSDRSVALARLDRALSETVVLGVSTNIEFLRALLASNDVRDGALDTGLIERLLPEMKFRSPEPLHLAAAALMAHAAMPSDAAAGPWTARSGWRLGEHRPSRYSFAVSATESVDIQVLGSVGSSGVAIGSSDVVPAALFTFPEESAPSHTGYPISAPASRNLRKSEHSTSVRASIEFGGQTRSLRIARAGASVWIGEGGFATELVLRDRATQLREHRATMTRVEGAADPSVRSPMPGTVVAVPVASGDSVDVGQTLLTIEAMKMEHKLLATVAGIVRLTVTPGDLVKLDEVVATITPHEGAPTARTEDPSGSPDTSVVEPPEGAQP